jgi:hypothetical protein
MGFRPFPSLKIFDRIATMLFHNSMAATGTQKPFVYEVVHDHIFNYR